MTPTSHHTRLLYEICKKRGIKCLVFSFVRFANRVMISEDSNSLSQEKIEPEKIRKNRKKYFIIKLKNFFKNKTRQRFIDNNLVKEVDFSKPFVYFPLHFEPEQVLLMGNAQFYSDQITVISNIAR